MRWCPCVLCSLRISMAVDQDPLIAQPGQVKAIASAIDERLRQRLSVFAAKTTESLVAADAQACTKAPSEAPSLRSTSELTSPDAVKAQSSPEEELKTNRDSVLFLGYLSWLNAVFLFFALLAVSLGVCAGVLDDAVDAAGRLIDGGGDIQEIHASLKLLEARFS